jgi:hypothetical protein
MDLSDLPSQVSWPALPADEGAQSEWAKMLYQAELDATIARYQATIDEIKARWRDRATHDAEEWKLIEARRDGRMTAEDGLRAAIQSAYLDVAKGAVDRALKRAEFLSAAAIAIGTTYTGLLALVYSVGDNQPNPLPASGIGPALFLGVAFVLSTFYVAYVQAGFSNGSPLPAALSVELQEERLLFFMRWVRNSSFRRAWALRTAVASLGIGVVLIPLPFLQFDETLRWWLIGACAALLVIVLIHQLRRVARRR